VPLLPIALATGWSALVLEAINIPLNPMSATITALFVLVPPAFVICWLGRRAEHRSSSTSEVQPSNQDSSTSRS